MQFIGQQFLLYIPVKNLMKTKIYACLCIAIIFSGCISKRQNDFSQYNLSLKNTLTIFLLNNENNHYFCIFLQYIDDFHISSFEFNYGNIMIGDFNISLNRDNVNILVYLNESPVERGNTFDEFNLVYQEKNGRVLISKMAEPLATNNKCDYNMNQYVIFIERHLTENEMKNIINQYRKGNINSNFYIWFDITIDNEEQRGSGLLDNFELYNGQLNKHIFSLIPYFDIFVLKYLQK